MKASKFERLVHQLVAAENTVRHSKDPNEVRLAEQKNRRNYRTLY